jgi:diguanylate cyclase (GGDEF)-like protein
MTGSWLCPTEADRQRVVDTSARVRRARLLALGFVAIGAVTLAPILSWWLLVLLALSGVNVLAVDRLLARSERPERVSVASIAFIEANFAVAAAITGGPLSPLLVNLVIPIGMMSARFRGRVVYVGGALAALTIVGVGLAVDPGELVRHPELTIVSLVLLGSIVATVLAIQGAELQHRSAAVLDPLTGLLNRNALQPRFAELREQARLSEGAVCLIETDLDHFKAVNDTFGHERGDAVLRDAAYAMRKTLRSFELIYRLGGEEFLVVLPRVGPDEGVEVAERLRSAVAEARPGGLDVTVSLGVASAQGASVDYDRLFAAADEALYAAKHAGRNRVALRPVELEAAPVPAPEQAAVPSLA